ncbi:MAG: hypothetical protein JXA04_10955 [Gammaproteobacteria bacterium]|nr:hypothetical protein [Gammaproteobacteria bacterium]
MFRRPALAFTTAFLFACSAVSMSAEELVSSQLHFREVENGSYTFDTGILKGVLRQSGKSTGLIPVIYKKNGQVLAAGEGLFNHYRVFTHGKRYGYGARRWPSEATLLKDGSVEIFWPPTPDRPFELRANYRWVAPDTIDLVTTVRAQKKLDSFEVFLASYYDKAFTESLVWALNDSDKQTPTGFISAKRELGDWLAFPRDMQALKVIGDGRWELEPHPLEWTMMPNFDKPLAIRRDPRSGLTVVVMTQRDDCFGIFTPYGEEKHFSNYLSLFGYDIEAGKIAGAHSRLLVWFNLWSQGSKLRPTFSDG